MTPSVLRFLLLAWLLGSGLPAAALDNPDGPDLLERFQERVRDYEAAIRHGPLTTQELVSAYGTYETFLDRELNAVYGQLMERLDPETRPRLRQAQRAWLQYRDAEFAFLNENWTRENFGTSSALSRGDYRTTLIKNRVLLLLSYLRNY